MRFMVARLFLARLTAAFRVDVWRACEPRACSKELDRLILSMVFTHARSLS